MKYLAVWEYVCTFAFKPIKRESMIKKITFITVVMVVLLSSFDVFKVNRMLLDGNISTVFHEGKDSATIECLWEKISPTNYRISINTTLEGKKFTVIPDSLIIVASCPEIEIYPSTSVGIPVTNHKFYTLSGKSRRFLSQSIEVVCRSSVDKDSLSLYLLPCNYILYEGKPVIKDTIMVTSASPRSPLPTQQGKKTLHRKTLKSY